MIISLLKTLEEQGVAYVSWKNNHLIEGSLSGKRDLDIYVPYTSKRKFLSIASKNKWISADNKFTRYPWVTHMYSFQPDGKHYHLHIYYKIVTGESRLKEYELHWGKYLLDNKIKDTNGVWILNKKAQSFIFIVRHLLKCGTYLSRNLYKKEIKSYKDEFNMLGGKIPFDDEAPLDIEPFIGDSGISNDGFGLPTIKNARRFKKTMSEHRRVRAPTIILQAKDFYYRVINKFLIRANKKILTEGGLIVSITGIDGSGKTTMLNHLENDMKQFLTVKKIHMGRPLPKILVNFVSFIRVFLVKNNKKKNVSPASKSSKIKNKEIMKSILSLLVAHYRFKNAKKCLDYSSKGYLVITDRWPTKTSEKMDGPRIICNDDSSAIVKLLSRLEKSIYKIMPETDICFIFTVSLETALVRNSGREEVEDESELIKRFKNNSNPNPISFKKIHFNNEGELEKQLAKFRKLYWEEIIATQR